MFLIFLINDDDYSDNDGNLATDELRKFITETVWVEIYQVPGTRPENQKYSYRRLIFNILKSHREHFEEKSKKFWKQRQRQLSPEWVVMMMVFLLTMKFNCLC